MRYSMILMMLPVSVIVVPTSTKAGDEPRRAAGSNLTSAVYEQTNVQGGLVVELGVADAQFTADLGFRDTVTLQALDTDPQRVFTIEEVACVGCCSLAPVIMLDDATVGRLTPSVACEAVERHRERGSA